MAGTEEPRTFHPSLEEWKDLPRYITYIESTGASSSGIVKIRAPAAWQPSSTPSRELYNPANMDLKIPFPLQQHYKPTPTKGAFESTSQVMPELSVGNFVRLATSERYVTPAHSSYKELEDLYWSYDMIDRAEDPIYGADVQHSLIDEDKQIWNVAKGEEGEMFNDLGRRLTRVDAGAYLYFGMWKATFSWHIEDMDLYGINFLHYGAPKSWYCVPPSQAYRLERAAESLFPQWANICKNFLRHKVCMMSPELLRSRGVTVHRVVQEERDLIVVFPHAYHSGFNHGFNIAEASNFGTPGWVEHGKRHRPCTCVDSDKVILLDMEPFVRKFQPERLEAWREGKDQALHPDDPQELWRVWEVSRKVAEGEVPEGLLDRLRKTGEEQDPGKEDLGLLQDELKALCRKQLRHFTLYREVLAGLRDVLDFQETQDWSQEDGGGKRKTNKVPVPEEFKEEASLDLVVNMETLKQSLKAKVKVKKSNKKHMKDFLENLPPKPVMSKKIAKLKTKQDLVRKLGFNDVTEEELESKRMTMKCYYTHKFGNCRKCSGCLTLDCGRCWACKDKPKFGGRGVQKQKCQARKCSNPVMHTCDKCTWNLDFLSQTL